MRKRERESERERERERERESERASEHVFIAHLILLSTTVSSSPGNT